jgi:acyl-CoA thioester hydrolase
VNDFPFVHEVKIRLRDLDCRGHVNNAVFSTFLEDARLRLYVAMGADDEPPPMENQVDMVLARTEIDFRGELRTPGETVSIGVRATRIGNKSADLEYRVCAQDGRLVAEAKSVLVGYDFDRGISTPIPQHWMRRLRSAGPWSSDTSATSSP